MRLFFSLSSFALTMIIALIALAYTLINFPTTMRDLLAGAGRVRDQIALLGLPDSYMVWVDILLQPPQIVFIGYSILTRLVIEIIAYFLSRRTSASGESSSSAPSPSSKSPFTKWG